MAMGGGFDQWQKDVFFSAAEAVQESADIMESIYRIWIRNRRNGFDLEASDETNRELQAALGTAKWQLEEFEKAVKVTHRSHSLENTITRHREFVAAIRNQILRVEKGLNYSLTEEGRQPLCWVQLDEEERDDLAVFLSGVPREGRQAKPKDVDHSKPEFVRSFKDTVTVNKDKRYAVEVAENEPYKSKDDKVHAKLEKLYGQTRVLSSPDIGAWEIVIADEDTDEGSVEATPEMLNNESRQSSVLSSVESTSKLKSFRNNLWEAKNEDHVQLRRGLSYYLDLKRVTQFAQRINGLAERSKNCFSNHCHGSELSQSQLLAGNAGGFRSHVVKSHHHMHFIHSLRIAFLLMLSIIFIVPFVIYSA